jgi:hypothetical protein
VPAPNAGAEGKERSLGTDAGRREEGDEDGQTNRSGNEKRTDANVSRKVQHGSGRNPRSLRWNIGQELLRKLTAPRVRGITAACAV